MNASTHTLRASAASPFPPLPMWPVKGMWVLVDTVRQWRAKRRLRSELLGLNGRELADIGLTRGEIDNLVQGYRLPAAERQGK